MFWLSVAINIIIINIIIIVIIIYDTFLLQNKDCFRKTCICLYFSRQR